MSGYLLDTSVVSSFGPSASQVPTAVAGWFERQERSKALYLSSVVAELEGGRKSSNVWEATNG
jgi:hypothetical protein